MQLPATVGVNFSFELPIVLLNGQTNNRASDAYIILAKGDALMRQIPLNDAPFGTGPVTNESFDDPIHPLERHHAMKECRPEVDDVVHHVDTQMHHDVKERGRELEVRVHLRKKSGRDTYL